MQRNKDQFQSLRTKNKKKIDEKISLAFIKKEKGPT